jgi:hypothetical protein
MAMLTAALTPQNSTPTFGITVVDPAGLHGRVFLLRDGTEKLPDFESLKAIGSIYTSSLNVHPQHWLSGFPGVTNRFDWFAIDYRGNFWITDPALYYFSLTSDDGSRLWIDDQLMIDNDGIHPAVTRFGSLRLKRGIHRLRVSYFQGPPDMLGSSCSWRSQERSFTSSARTSSSLLEILRTGAMALSRVETQRPPTRVRITLKLLPEIFR